MKSLGGLRVEILIKADGFHSKEVIMAKKERKESLWLGYVILVVLLVFDLLLFYKFAFFTGNVSLDINLAKSSWGSSKIFWFAFSIAALVYFAYQYFYKQTK